MNETRDDESVDLFAPAAPEPTNANQRAHIDRYAHIRGESRCADVRARITEWWRTCHSLDLLDTDFRDRFPTEFGSRVWELRLGASLAEWQMDVRPSPRRNEGPDMRVLGANGSTTWFEAVCPGPGTGADRAEFPIGFGAYGGDIDRRIGLRIVSAIDEKREKWRRWASSGLVSPSDAYVVAISGSMIDLADFDVHEPRIARLLLGFGGSIYRVSLDSGEVERDLEPKSSLSKANGSGVVSGLFADDDAPEVSAVLFSASHSKELPEKYGGALGSEMVLVVNPFAAVPWSLGHLPIAGAWTRSTR